MSGYIAGYSNSYVYTHLGELWQGPLPGGNTTYQYLYCNSQPHQLSGLYAAGSTCSSKSGQVYATSYDAFGNVSSHTFTSTTAALSYDILDHFTQWYVSSSNHEQYLYEASGTRVLRRTTNSSGTTIIVYAFKLESTPTAAPGRTRMIPTTIRWEDGCLGHRIATAPPST